MIKYVPEKQIYNNIFSKKMFKAVLEHCLGNPAGDPRLEENLLPGALAAVELDCIADLKNTELNALMTKQHYLEYVKITDNAVEKTGSNHLEVRNFINRMNQYCSYNSDQLCF